MKKRVLTVLIGMFVLAAQASAQQKTVTGKVTDEANVPLSGVSVVIRGTTNGTATGRDGAYVIRATPGQVLQYKFIGTIPVERTVGAANVIDVSLKRVPTSLDAVVVTALGQTAQQRALGTSQQTVSGTDIAGTQRENFINSLQGRVAGVDVTSTSGVAGASTSITIRGVSSISSSNQPLMIIDGLPVDNKTLNTSVLGSDAPGSAYAFNNRGVDFTNRGADINPEDIESLTVLKGPEAAALYGIDAANGAIVITTKRGRTGGGLQYSNSFAMEAVNAHPQVQQKYAPSGVGSTTFLYFGAPYADTTHFYDNIDGFFQKGMSQQHNLSFSGAAPDNRMNYRVATSVLRRQGVVPGNIYNRVNVTGSSQSQVTHWLAADLSMGYTNAGNDQSFKGDNGPLLGLLIWPSTDNASDYLSAAGQRRRITTLSAASEVDNPYFSVNKNKIGSKNNRIITNLGLTLNPWSWGNISSKIGADYYGNQLTIVRNPESALALTQNGLLDVTDDITRNINLQTLVNINSHHIAGGLSVSGLVGNAIQDARANDDALVGANFLDPNFTSINNTASRNSRTTLSQRRLIGAFAQAVFDYKNYFFLTLQGRNDWTSTIPTERNSFFYPSVTGSYILSDAFPSIGKHMTAKIRAAFAEVGRDARPYAYVPSLEYKTTSNGGYGYGFTGPNPLLKPEFAKSYEVGTELSWFQDRLGLNATVYRKRTTDQIVNDIRGSYGTGFILLNLNGASTENKGLEVEFRATPILRTGFSWDVQANFESARGKTLSLPNALPESYVSDTWLYNNVRNGTSPGLSTLSLTGLFYLRNNQGQVLIDPTTGLPLKSPSLFIDAGYDRQPNYTVGINNSVRMGKLSVSALVDIRKGGDVFNATEHYLTVRGLATSTLDRFTPRVIPGVIRDGKENSATPTANNIVVVPGVNTGYYTNMSEELFIEKNINWLRLRDVTVSYALPDRVASRLNAQAASFFVTGTDLYLLTNYSGLDPIVNGNSAAVGGSGGVGIDYGNFPIPRGLNLGLKIGF